MHRNFTDISSPTSRILTNVGEVWYQHFRTVSVKDSTATIVEQKEEMFLRLCGLPPLLFH